MSTKHYGSCLCGEVHYEVAGNFDSFFLCHCGRCRKDTGSAHAANLFSTTATLTWISGEKAVRTFQLPETRHARSFCGTCGSALPLAQMGGALLAVPAGSLDSHVANKPNAHICVGSKATWDEALETYPKIEALPES